LRIGHLAVRALGVALLLATTSGVAQARNPHCSGGILYVTQAMRDKDKGELESYQRQIHKAVFELRQCAAEDPTDFEALGYLGWALAEVDSAGPAGAAFEAAIAGLQAKGDKKKVDMVSGNRSSFWARTFNEGIGHIQSAQDAYSDFTKPPADEAETTLRGVAEKHYREALVALTRASSYKRGDPQTLRNLGSVYVFMGEFQKAEETFLDGLRQVPGDSSLAFALRTARVNRARSLVDAQEYDTAIAAFADLLKTEPNDPDHHLGMADACFRRAQGKQGEARAADFKLAADSYARAGELKPTDADLPFNAALAYQNAGALEKAEAQWRLAVKLRPEDVDALSSLGAVLADLKKYDEAIRTLHAAVQLKPQNKTLHRQFGSVYTKAGNNAKATEELMIFLAMQNGQPSADPAASARAAPAGSDAARILASDGVPEQTISWTAEQESYESWFYWEKKRVYTFKAGKIVTRSDWSAAPPPSGGRN
jgi:tetratricopeptide (TPR) repeat protein